MKTCTLCNKSLPLDEFYKRAGRGTYESCCKACFITRQSERMKARYDKNRAKALELREMGATKSCNSCGSEQPYSSFNFQAKNADGHSFNCRDCSRPYAKKYYETNRARVKELSNASRQKSIEAKRAYLIQHYRNNPCVDCGATDIRVLQSDHQRDKKYEIGEIINSGYSVAVLAAELAKCETRCANCHQIRTAIQFNHWRNSYVV